jgi:CRISPR system Cascade subunit CasD
MPGFLHLRLAGPLLSLQGPCIDGQPQGLEIPTRSMITGLLGAARGIDRAEVERLQALQDGMALAIVVHRPGTPIIDFQTTDLTKPHLRGPMWKRGGGVVKREGSADALTRHVQHRPYLCDADMSVLVDLSPRSGMAVEEAAEAVQRPRWPLGLGRRCCMPSRPIFEEIIEADGIEAAALAVAAPGEAVYLPATLARPGIGDRFAAVPELRDWRTRRHGGATIYVRRAA